MQSCELVTFVTAVACAISQCYSEDELELLSAIFTQLGDTINTILSQEQLCGNDNDSGENPNPATKNKVSNTVKNVTSDSDNPIDASDIVD